MELIFPGVVEEPCLCPGSLSRIRASGLLKNPSRTAAWRSFSALLCVFVLPGVSRGMSLAGAVNHGKGALESNG